MLDVQVQYALPRRGLPAPTRLHRAARAAWRGETPAAVTLRIVDVAEGLQLNAQFRGRQQPTNVLSFPAPNDTADLEPWGPRYLGDIVICAPVLAAEATQQGKSLAAHYAHLVVHGLLHLQGYDHQTADEARVMETIEREILDGLGYPDPYVLAGGLRRYHD